MPLAISNCPIRLAAERVKANPQQVTSHLNRKNIEKLIVHPQNGGIKGLYVRQVVDCLEASPLAVYGYPGPNGILQHMAISDRLGFEDPEAGEKNPPFWGFRITPIKFAFGISKETRFFDGVDGRLILATWQGYKEMVKDRKVNIKAAMKHIETPTSARLRKNHVYGYLFPRGEEYARPWVVSTKAGINPGKFPYVVASDLLQAVARSAYPDFFVFDFFTHRPVYIAAAETCVNVETLKCRAG
jgi:hypothetical protein